MKEVGARRLGDYLLKAAVVTKEQLAIALQEKQRTGELLGNVLVRFGFATPEAVAGVLADQAGLPYVNLEGTLIDPEVVALVPEPFARRHRLIPIGREGNALRVAVSNVFDVNVVDELQRMTGMPVSVVSASEAQILKLIDRYCARSGAAATVLDELIAGADEDRADAPVVRIVSELFRKAGREGATDIHIEPDEKTLRTRFRLDGILQPGPTLPKALHSAVVTHVKILANLNISESRLPQDGRILYQDGPHRLDLRVSTFPTIHGENLSIRVLDRARTFELDQLGLRPEMLEQLKSLLEKPYGLILVTGPTGAGKTTTLYSALTRVNAVEKNVMTLEDPVEYEIAFVRQCQINPRAGLTFATGLRSVLRHDPDVILVGEMRDFETVETTIRAALTGHLVFSTFHTNDAVGAIARLLEMGVEPFLVASSLLAVLAQRLVRVVCRQCRFETTPSPQLAARLGPAVTAKIPSYSAGKGCVACNFTGYRGRIGIFELLPITTKIARLITRGADPSASRAAALAAGFESMFLDGLRKVAAGLTTPEEVIRVSYQLE